MAAGAMRTVKSAVSRRRQAEDRHNHGGMATPQPAPLQTQRAPASPAGLFIAGADKGALAARRTLQPTDQHDDADDRRGDPDLDGTVPVKRAEHARTLYAPFRCVGWSAFAA